METIKFKVNEEIVRKIELLQFEYESKKDILSYMIYNDYPQNDAFKRYQEDFMKCFTEYNLAKENLQKTVIEPKVKGKLNEWNLEFDTCEVTASYAKN